MYCIVGSRTSLLLLSLPCICPIFFPYFNNGFYIPALKNVGGYTGLHLSVVPFIHLSFCLSVLFCSLRKAIYITSATAGVKSEFLTVLVFLCFSLVTINRQTSYDYGILRQDCRIIRKNHKRFADWVTTWVVHLPEASLITA